MRLTPMSNPIATPGMPPIRKPTTTRCSVVHVLEISSPLRKKSPEVAGDRAGRREKARIEQMHAYDEFPEREQRQRRDNAEDALDHATRS